MRDKEDILEENLDTREYEYLKSLITLIKDTDDAAVRIEYIKELEEWRLHYISNGIFKELEGRNLIRNIEAILEESRDAGNYEHLEQLIMIIENTDNISLRIKSIKELENLGVASNRIFKKLEEWVISDEEPQIKHCSAEALINLFPEKCLEPIKWMIANSYSEEILLKFLNSIKKKNIIKTKDLIDLLYKIYSSYYKLNNEEARALAYLRMKLYKDDSKSKIKITTENGHISSMSIFCEYLTDINFKPFSYLKILYLYSHNDLGIIKGLYALNQLFELHINYYIRLKKEIIKKDLFLFKNRDRGINRMGKISELNDSDYCKDPFLKIEDLKETPLKLFQIIKDRNPILESPKEYITLNRITRLD